MLPVNKSGRQVKRNYFLALELVGLGLLVGIDIVFKQWAEGRGAVVMNHGGVLGVLPEFWWLTLLLGLWLALLIHWLGHPEGWYRFGLLLILSGGLANLIDRIQFDYVRDFIYYPGFKFYGNVADIYLVAGVIVCILHYVLSPSSQTDNKD